mgnify:CR=1 FL=1
MQVTNKAVLEALDGLPPLKVHCSLLAEEAIHAALWDYAKKHHMIGKMVHNLFTVHIASPPLFPHLFPYILFSLHIFPACSDYAILFYAFISKPLAAARRLQPAVWQRN